MGEAVNILFAAGVAVTAIVTWILGVLRCRAISGGPARPRDLHPFEVAYLSDGPKQTVAAALGALYVGGVYGMFEDPGDPRPYVNQYYMRIAGRPRLRPTPLEEAVIAAGQDAEQRRRRGFRFEHVYDDARVQEALKAIKDGLERDGLIVSRRQRRRVRVAGLPLLLPPALCVLWMAAILAPAGDPDEPGRLWFIIALLGLFILGIGAEGVVQAFSGASKAGKQSRKAALARYQAMGRYPGDPEHAAMSIAFGARQVAGIDPPFAMAAKIYRSNDG